ncbi:MAG: hypothetical protein K6C36_04875 [Clostridia bacterium]|nr:hypothetical protein [Clostridia bacterium]
MQLLVLILSKTALMPGIISRLMQEGYGDPTVISGEGAVSILDSSNIEPPPIFGSLRRFINGTDKHENKLMLLVLPDEKVEAAQELISEEVGGIEKPNTGIMFTLPIGGVRGLFRAVPDGSVR